MEKAADYARKNNIPLLLAGVGNDLKNMKNTLSAWNFPTDKLMQIDSPASDLKDSVRKSADYLQAGQKFKEPVVFTDPLKIPRTRCEFYKKDMKSARFYNILNPDIGLNAKTIQDSYNYSSRTKSDIFKEASLYFFTADCRL